MKKTINFGKVDYNGRGRKVNAVEVEIELKDDGRLSICGAIWNAKHTDCFTCGQCLDTIKQYLPLDKKFREIFHLWKDYHLNDLKAGTHRQISALIDYHKRNNTTNWDYVADSEYLKSIGLFVDDLRDDESWDCHPEIRKGYEYGKGWLTWTIPEAKINRIKEIING